MVKEKINLLEGKLALSLKSITEISVFVLGQIFVSEFLSYKPHSQFYFKSNNNNK